LNTITIRETVYNLDFLVSMRYHASKMEKTRADTPKDGSGEVEYVKTGEVESNSSLILTFVGLGAPITLHGDEADKLATKLTGR
jgi:hypothetical protein